MYSGLDLGAGKASDAEVIAASVSDPERFAAIFERHFEAIHRYLARRLGVTVADDLAAQVFTIAFERRRHFDLTSTTARPWLYGISANLIRNNRRSERRLLATLARIHTQRDDRSGTEPSFDADPAERTRVAAAIARLRPEQREVLLLHCWADLSHAEIAAALQIPPGTVASRLSRARRGVRDLLGGSDENQGQPTVTSKEE
jgi:RNA polymerase sigma factor (sigma-70 family)